MAQFKADGIDGLALTVQEIAEIPEDVKRQMLTAGGEVAAEAQRRKIRALGLVDTGKLAGSMSILIMPMGPGALMYAPRGPVCDYDDRETIADLLEGAKVVAKKYHAHILKMDPYILEGDEAHIELFRSLGCEFTPDAAFKDTIQPRYNYMLP